MGIILKIDSGVRKISQWMSFGGAIWIFIIMLIITYDVIAKNFMNSSFVGAAEIVRNSIVGIAFFMIPWATASLSHVRTTILVDRVNNKVKKILNILTYTIGFVLFVAIVISSWGPFVAAYVNHEYELTGSFNWPNWPVKGIIVMGSALSAWNCGVYVLQNITGTGIAAKEVEVAQEVVQAEGGGAK